MKWLTILLCLIPSATLATAPSSVDTEREKAELLRIHKADREAHFRTDVNLLQERSPAVLISVRSGRIERTSKADERAHFEEYFRGARYYEWDDLEEPIISVSGDGSMAWMITRIRVRRVQKDASGGEREQKFVYAGIMTYEKKDGTWVRVANVSTFEPQE